MKKIVFLYFLLFGVLTSCQKDDGPTPGERPEERLSKILSEYKTQLTGAPHGWKAVLYPEGGGGYNFHFKFNQTDQVVMTSDINATSATAMESTYRLKTMQRPSLLFDTYSYLHILSDPDAEISGGEYGAGRYSDFEFSFTEVSADRIVLTGNRMGSKLILTRATQQEAENFIANTRTTASTFENLNKFTSYFKRLTIGTSSFDINIDQSRRIITFHYSEDGAAKRFTTSFSFTADGLLLQEPLVALGLNLTSFESVQYNAGNNRFNLTVNNTAATVREAATPIVVDLQAATRFYNNTPNGYFWFTANGFTVDGRRDAFNINAITGFNGITFYVQVVPPFDGFLFWTRDGKYFGPALRAQFPSNGRLRFTYAGEFSDYPDPQTEAIVTQTRNQLIIPEGYFVVQTTDQTYDLVSARDGKAWISFE